MVTRAPISRAVVSWSGGTTQTNELGAFQLPAPKSQIWLDVMAKGFLSRTEWVSLELARAGGRLDLSLSPVSVIEGQVLEQGTPRAGVSVWAELTEGMRRGERTPIVLSNAKGEFRIECSEGLRRVMAVTPAGVTFSGPEVRISVGDTLKGVVVELGDLGLVSGTIRKDGTPFSTASLTLVNAFAQLRQHDHCTARWAVLVQRRAHRQVPRAGPPRRVQHHRWPLRSSRQRAAVEHRGHRGKGARGSRRAGRRRCSCSLAQR